MGLYFDHAATTPAFPEALARFTQIHQDFFANPSSQHQAGKNAKKFYETLKEQFCQKLNFHDGWLLQSSSATESNNMVVHSFLKQHPEGQILIGIDTHASLWYIQNMHPKQCSSIPLKEDGQYNFNGIEIDQKPTLVLLNTISQDLGTRHTSAPWRALSLRSNVHLHLDATQSFGKHPIDCDQLPFHTLSASAHKFGGLRGCGLLFIRNSHLSPLIYGGGQEDGVRAGTENIASLAAAERAYDISLQQYDHDKLKSLDVELRNGLNSLNAQVLFNDPSNKLPGLNNVSFPGYQGSELVRALSLKGVQVATGSACSESKTIASRAVIAYGRTESEGLGSLRICFGAETQKKDISLLIEHLEDALKTLAPS